MVTVLQTSRKILPQDQVGGQTANELEVQVVQNNGHFCWYTL